MVKAAPVRPPSPENPNVVSKALSGLNLAPRGQCEEHRPAMSFEANEIRIQIAIHMGPDPLYDDMLAFFASYAELSTLYDTESSSYHDCSRSGPGTFLH